MQFLGVQLHIFTFEIYYTYTSTGITHTSVNPASCLRTSNFC